MAEDKTGHKGPTVRRIGKDDEFERMWQEHQRQEREFAEAFLSGAYSDEAAKAAGRERGALLEDVIGSDRTEILLGELERLNVAVLVHMGALNQGNALRLVRYGGYSALSNTGFRFENGFFRLAAYDWSEDEDEDGNWIHRPDFAVRGAGNYLEWYKWARRDDWVSAGFAWALEEAEERNIPVFGWFERVIDRCIDSLMSAEDIEASETTPCPWRDFDETRTPRTVAHVDGPQPNDEMQGLTFDHPDEGYVGFVRIPGAPADAGVLTDVTGETPEVADAVAEALRRGAGDFLSNSLSTHAGVPDDLGYIAVGGTWFQRVFMRRR